MFFDMRTAFFALFLVPALLLCVPGIAHAQGLAEARVMSEGEYEEALAFLEGTKAAMAEAEAALGTGSTRAEAETRKADLGQRLDILRRLMTAAAQRDRIGAGGTKEQQGDAGTRTRAGRDRAGWRTGRPASGLVGDVVA
ncbi:hypothetical protein, partial [Parvibaculum sp.]